MYKAIGFIACVSVMATSLYLFSGGDPSRSLSAQTESANADSYGSVARRFMSDARQLAKEGNLKQARQLAETAASLSASWQDGEQTPTTVPRGSRRRLCRRKAKPVQPGQGRIVANAEFDRSCRSKHQPVRPD